MAEIKDKLVLLDAGHGGMIDGHYVTPGKRSPKWTDLPQLFEGVQNRRIVAKIKELLVAKQIPFLDVVNSEKDISLNERVATANKMHRINKNALYVSIHADAHGNGSVDTDASGLSVWTSVGDTQSDPLAECVLLELSANIKDNKFRLDKTDGDGDQEENFHVLKNTSCPAILCELGFMTNRKECEEMLTQEWVDVCAKSIVDGIIKFYSTRK